mmetsp:Transcript_16833/g.19091  ORF Transcript_16833/g.19091 Transcript_16833/m.19091 type:complete len:294 (+) Transcript_16833:179-1060(+)
MSSLTWNTGPPNFSEFKGLPKPEEKKDGDEVKAQNRWTEPPAKLYNMRGKDYLTQDGKFKTNNLDFKEPSQESAYECVGLNLYTSNRSRLPACDNIASLRDLLASQKGVNEIEGDMPQFFVVSWSFNNFFKTQYTFVVHLFKRRIPLDSSGDSSLERALSKFFGNDDEYKRDRFKFEAKFRDFFNAGLKKSIDMLGGERPVIIGRKLTTEFHRRDNCFEVCMDVGSSSTASMLYSLVMKTSGSLSMDYCFYVEGQEEDELPERVIGICQWNYCTLEDCARAIDDEGKVIEDKK